MRELFKSERLPCFKVPPAAKSVLVSWDDQHAGWKVEFETEAGWMVLVRKTNYKEVLTFKSLDTLVKRLRGEGWVNAILLAEWQA